MCHKAKKQWGNLGLAKCQEMANLPVGYVPKRKVPSASSSGSLGFIVCLKCYKMVDSVQPYYLYPVANTVRPSVGITDNDNAF